MLKRYAPALTTFILLLGCWSYTTWSTWNAPSYDGNILYGFPQPFAREGGHCAEGYCPFQWHAAPLAADVALLVAAPVVIQLLANFRRRKRQASVKK